jgi:DNA-directed RNA polymerase subunit omega
VPLLSSTAAAPAPASGGGDDADIQFDRMSEEDLLRGLDDLVPPAESDDEE